MQRTSFSVPKLRRRDSFPGHTFNRLKGHFSRIDYVHGEGNHHKTNVLKSLRATLPAKCKNVFYRDDVGNVSTSHLSVGSKKTILDLQPRYPLYGGWKYKWHQGYDAPLAGFQKKLGDNRYSLQLPFTAPIMDMLVENMEVSIILPEGAS